MPRDAPALGRWIADPVRRAATEARRRALARNWAADTPLPALAAALDALVAPDAAAVAALARPVLEDADWLDRAVARLAAAVRDDDFLEPPLTAIDTAVHGGLVLLASRHATIFASVGSRAAIAAKRAGPRAGSIVFPGTLGLLRVVRGGGAMLSLWRGGGAAMRCVPAGRHRLADGETLAIDGRTTSFVVESMARDMLLLQATILAGPAATSCAYDAVTLDLVESGAAREGASRSQMLATLLAEVGSTDAAAFARAAAAPEPFARWHAMRCWAASDFASARGTLERMAADDPDAELRALARRTLALCPA